MKRFTITASGGGKSPIPVFASYDKKQGVPDITVLALHHCKECDSKVVQNKVMYPGCPICASVSALDAETDLTLDRKDFANMKKVAECTNCGTVVNVPEEMQASFEENKMYCTTCSHPILADTDEEEDPNEEEEEDDEFADEEFPDEEEDENLDETVSNTDYSETEGEMFDNPPAADAPKAESTPPATEEATTTETPPTDETATTETPAEGEGNSETTTETSTEQDNAPKTDSINASLLAYFSDKDTTIDLVKSGDKWYLMANNTPVAIAESSRAAENVKGLFDSDNYKTSFFAASGEGVTQEMLDEFGFEPVKVDVPVDEAVRQEIAAQVEEVTRKYEGERAEMVGKFQQCVGIAAVGINKNAFGIENPLRQQMVAAVRTAGVRHADRIVGDVFKKHGETYLREIVAKALDLMGKSDETLNEISAMVDKAPFQENEVTPEPSKKVVPFSATQNPAKEIEEDENNDEVKTGAQEATASDGEEDYSAMFGKISGRLK